MIPATHIIEVTYIIAVVLFNFLAFLLPLVYIFHFRLCILRLVLATNWDTVRRVIQIV